MTRAELEIRVHQLVGLTPRRVTYFEIDYGDSRPAWSSDPRFDSLDFGLQLVMTSGEAVNLSWGGEFYQYGVSFGVQLEAGGTTRAWDVSEASRWNALLGKRIEDARVFWSWVDGADIGRVHYPQDLKLTFEGGREIYISALEIRPNGFCMGMMDHITVFFEEAVARQFGVGTERSE